ncbi:MAG: DNA cytosine methyltransferase [Opitutaceae bacterium]|nr:DNA cytosine methyltransferase [Verrucomicrobiales bacterium]
MVIHPTQNRSLSPRETAGNQSFPDWFEFPIARTHQFRVIGNTLPAPLRPALVAKGGSCLACAIAGLTGRP